VGIGAIKQINSLAGTIVGLVLHHVQIKGRFFSSRNKTQTVKPRNFEKTSVVMLHSRKETIQTTFLNFQIPRDVESSMIIMINVAALVGE
jgi:hypothetical protein